MGYAGWVRFNREHLSYSLNSLKGVIYGIILGSTIGVIKEDTRSLDKGSLRVQGLGV